MRSFLTDQQIDKVYKDHMHHFIDVAELVNDLRHYKQLAEQRGKALEEIIKEAPWGDSETALEKCVRIAKQAFGRDNP